MEASRLANHRAMPDGGDVERGVAGRCVSTYYWHAMDEPTRRHFELKGKRAEEVVHNLAVQSFLADWCFISPRKPNGNEICDLLVVFDDLAIIWQVKDLKLNKKGEYREAEVLKNLRQLAGARRYILERRGQIHVENSRRGRIQIDPASIARIYLISVMMGEGEAVSGFMDLVREQSVHVFTREFAEIAFCELDTITDFVGYLAAKEAFLTRDIEMMIIEGGEEELLACYLLHGEGFGFEKANVVHVNRGFWRSFRSGKTYSDKRSAAQISYLWDHIISRAHEGSSQYELLARELARPDRRERTKLAKIFAGARNRAGQVAEKADLLREVVGLNGTTYCFLFQEPNAGNHSRAEYLQASCFVARTMIPAYHRVVGIATDRVRRPTDAFDFCFISMPELDDQVRSRINDARRALGMFLDAESS